MTEILNDCLDDLIGGDRREPVAPPAAYAAVEASYTEPCKKCRGTGRFVSWGGRTAGQCFTCKGAGKFTFKTSPEARAAATGARNNRRDRDEKTALADFAAANPAIAAWIEAEHLRFAFAADMRASILRFGRLTEGQLAACQRLVDREAARTAERTQRAASAPTVASEGIDRLKASFDKAIAYSREKGLKLSPRITIDGTTISPAKATSANPGALYVKASGTYLGKITDGRFFASRECSKEAEAKVLAFIADPAEAAKVYGQTTGTCCICNATLISKWKNAGIGPICAQKFGW